MNSRWKTMVAAGCAALGFVVAVGAQGTRKEQAAPIKKPAISIHDPWVAEGPPMMKMTAAFFRIENRGASPAALVGVRTDAARTVELHEVVNENNQMAMRQVERMAVPPSGQLELRPGGLHLMLIGLTRTLQAGDKVEMTLKFADGTETTVSATVRKRREGDDRSMGGKTQ